ncbi:MAG TPA: hypothetical protein DCG34_01065 [Clostridiales bacterium]|jgi:antitoxin component of RelBE/YafQ-DinJ toxin-antitoxin module|nr:hypothetical protein [Clostridiales bacterium]
MANNNRLEVRLPDGTQAELERIVKATGHDPSTVVRSAIQYYLHHLVEIGEVPSKSVPDRDVGFEFLEKVFGVKIKQKVTDV